MYDSYIFLIIMCLPLHNRQINPAVTVGLVVIGKVSIMRACVFIPSQVLGGSLAALFLRVALPNYYFTLSNTTFGVTMPYIEEPYGITVLQAIAIEGMLTAILFLAVCSAVDNITRSDQFGLTPIMIGFTVAACALALVHVLLISRNCLELH